MVKNFDQQQKKVSFNLAKTNEQMIRPGYELAQRASLMTGTFLRPPVRTEMGSSITKDIDEA